ncbi:MAG: HNH endonuclease [Deltaproteobacteria bacterium]|nr:HNH endonuclease [Deltaproteobacteria bacterium]
MPKSSLTQKQLKEILHYSPETGLFVWLTSPTKSVKIGDIAGTLGSRGYVRIMIEGKNYQSHRLAWFYVYGVWPLNHIDHINHIKDDNRIVNLREATGQENQRNASLRKSNTSGVCGVSLHKTSNKWQATIGANDKNIHLGLFSDKFEAICARKSADNKYGFHANHGL